MYMLSAMLYFDISIIGRLLASFPLFIPSLLYPTPQLNSLMISEFIGCISKFVSLFHSIITDDTQLRSLYLYVLIHAGQGGSPGGSSGETLANQETAHGTRTGEGLRC